MTAPAPEPSPAARSRRARWVAVGAGLLLAWMLFAATCVVYRVEGQSMSPALHPGEQVVAFRYGSVARGDLIVFRNPLDPRELLIKRVHALGGQTVALSQGKLVVDGVPAPLPTTFFDELPARKVEPGHVFVLGDNQATSLDSRRLGTVDASLVVGTVLCRLWPPSRVQ
ncbi:MAG: signal peptidase I [Planctomycetota bacterium]